ncbi:MAG: hypothetical protein ABI665_03830 [Vicinamibacterales bacterium]
MANKERGEMKLVAGDRTFKLRLTTNAVVEIEDISGGRTWDQVQLGLMRGSAKDMRLLFWGALREFHSDIATDDPKSLRAVGKLIDDAGGFEGLVEQMKAFIVLNQRQADTESDGRGGEAAPLDPPNAQSVVVGADSTLTPALSG